MTVDFSQLIADIAQEARDEGPQAVRELEQFSEEFSLASQLIESRREGELSQRELAKLSGVPQSEISRIETGTSNPTYATITALLRPLGKRVQLVDDGGTITAQKVGNRRARTARAPEGPKGAPARSTSSPRAKGASRKVPSR
jgi:transcriptional regulator with XRE-family HTH domain